MEDVYKAIMKGKKRPDQLEDAEKNAMMGVLKDIHGMASDDMGHDIHGLKKVSVASNTENGLKAGLEKAKGMIQNHAHGTMDDDDAEAASKAMRNPDHSQLDHSTLKDEVSDEDPEMHDDENDLHAMRGHEDDEDHMGKGAANGSKLHRYANGGEVADVNGAEHQSNQSRGVDSKAAMPTIGKERDMHKDSASVDARAAHMQDGTHGDHASADEYADLAPEDLEALIAHLQRYRK